MDFISIHAPAGGASIMMKKIYLSPSISIHAPAGGASVKSIPFSSDHPISIHAPAGGASCKCDVCASGAYFNSRPCGRGFIHSLQSWYNGGGFQFTPLREGLREHKAVEKPVCYFNSRPCGRGFSKSGTLKTFYSISIHAPAGGASSGFPPLFSCPNPFQFTPLREGLHY